MRYAFIKEHRARFEFEVLLRVLEVSSSGFYAWQGRPKSAHAVRDEVLVKEVGAIHASSRGRYGSPRVHAELKARGERVSCKRVSRLMRHAGLRGRGRSRSCKTTDSSHALPVAENVLGRDFATTGPNQKRASDITYLWTSEGWLYLAIVLDLFSRKVVGWAMGETLEANLVLKALSMARVTRRPEPGLVHHSDRGSQYASRAYQAALEAMGSLPSMSRKGNCWDNAVAESFFATLKAELDPGRVFSTRREARRLVFEFIEGYYNRQRRHSSLGYHSPVGFEELKRAA